MHAGTTFNCPEINRNRDSDQAYFGFQAFFSRSATPGPVPSTPGPVPIASF